MMLDASNRQDKLAKRSDQPSVIGLDKSYKVYHVRVVFHQVSRMRVHRSGKTHKGGMWKHPQILGILGKWGMGGRHIYNIKNIKYKILKIKIIMIKSQQ
jgi:hypothetical protein